jgi:hypothetical protein
MPLKAVLETLDGIDDAVKPFYAEADGRFVLAVEGVDDHPEVANLRNAYARTKDGAAAAKAEAAALKARIADLEKGAPDTAATQAKLAQLQEQLAAKEAEAQTFQAKYMGVTRDQALSTALQAAGISEPTFLKASQAMLSGMVKLGEDGTAYVETGMGPKVLADFIKGWAASEGKAFVTPPAGGGAKGKDGPGAGKSMTRTDFDGLAPDRRAAFIREGGTVTQ